ncbi:MAG: hypothetical protein U0J62_10750 [Lachnospiraceae bacterium]|nr:hypothetical protein [Lachnospiraceae bacterium]
MRFWNDKIFLPRFKGPTTINLLPLTLMERICLILPDDVVKQVS